MVGDQPLGGVRHAGSMLGRGRGWLAEGHCSWGHTWGFRGEEAPRITPSHYRQHLRANMGLERPFPPPPAPTNKALPLLLPGRLGCTQKPRLIVSNCRW